MIRLYQFPSGYDRPFSISPFCAKLEAYFRLAKVEYTPRNADPRKAPSGKAPYIVHEGQTRGDSQRIIDWCKETFGDPLDGELTKEQHSIGHLLRITAENRLYFAVIYHRWVDDLGWPDQRAIIAKLLPKLLSGFLPGVLRRGVKKQLHEHGLGRGTNAQVYATAAADLAAIAATLGDKPFLLGDTPTSYDCAVYAPVAGGLATFAASPVAAAIKEHQNLVDWVARMDEAIAWE